MTRFMSAALGVAALAGVVALAGCATITGEIDDNGRAFERTNNAPVNANLEPLAAEPTIEIFNDRLGTPLGGNGGRSAGTSSACAAERWQSLVGLRKAEVEVQRLPASARVVDWGAMVTQDFRPERLNVQLDQTGRVYRVVCG